MSAAEMLKDMMGIFPVEGQVVPYVELKFRLGAKYGQDVLDDVLTDLVNKEILSRFEFNNTVHYKSKKDIPLSLAGSAQDTTDPSQLSALSELVLALAESSSDDRVSQLLDQYKQNFG